MKCGLCRNQARGFAMIDGQRYCHPDDGRDCYTEKSRTLYPYESVNYSGEAERQLAELRQMLSELA